MARSILVFLLAALSLASLPASAQLPDVTDSAEAQVAVGDTSWTEEDEAAYAGAQPMSGSVNAVTYQYVVQDISGWDELSGLLGLPAFPGGFLWDAVRALVNPFLGWSLLSRLFSFSFLELFLRLLLPALLLWGFRRLLPRVERRAWLSGAPDRAERMACRSWRRDMKWGAGVAAVGCFFFSAGLILAGGLLLLWHGRHCFRKRTCAPAEADVEPESRLGDADAG